MCLLKDCEPQVRVSPRIPGTLGCLEEKCKEDTFLGLFLKRKQPGRMALPVEEGQVVSLTPRLSILRRNWLLISTFLYFS